MLGGVRSNADELITRRLREALSPVEIGVLDHLIVAADSITSLAEQGILLSLLLKMKLFLPIR